MIGPVGAGPGSRRGQAASARRMNAVWCTTHPRYWQILMTEYDSKPANDGLAAQGGESPGPGGVWPESAEAMPGALQTYLARLCERAGVAFDDSLTEDQGLERIKELEKQLGQA